MRHDNIIELNGKQYEATTGVLIGDHQKQAPQAAHPAFRTMRQGRSVDGFVRTAAKPESPKPAEPVTKLAPAPHTHPDIAVTRAQHHVRPHAPERTRTLMRRAVAKPGVMRRLAIRTIPAGGIVSKTASELTMPFERKASVFQIDAVRLAHAHHIRRSHFIRHFVPQPAEPVTVFNPIPAAPSRLLPKPSVSPHSIATVSHSPSLDRAWLQLSSQHKAQALFENALSSATSHEQPKHEPQGKRSVRHKRLTNALAGIAAFLVIGGFITYLNMPSIELNVASMRAGFHAAAPGYQPSGYSLANGIRASKGKIEMTYQSGSSSYKITQTASDWNSSTLLDQNLEHRGAPTKTVQSKGRIIYIYDDDATWVNGGVVYDVSGNTGLRADDLVSLATSM